MIKKKKISQIELTLFMTEGMSIKKWYSYGMLNREISLYKEMIKEIKSVKIFSYGTVSENSFINFNKIEILHWFYNRAFKIYRLFGLYIHYRKLSNSDIFKTNQISGSAIAVKAKKLFKKPLIVRCGYIASVFSLKRGDSKAELNRIILLEDHAFNNADKIIVTCQRDKNIVIKKYFINPDKIHIVPNHVDTNLFKPKKEIKKIAGRLCFVGRLDEQKNLVNLLKAVEKVESINELIIIGEGPLKKELQKISKDMKTKVNFLGIIKNKYLPEVIQTSEVFILPSLYEGMPKTILEAMSCGMPCIGANSEGIKEIINHRKNALLCEIDYESIAETLTEIYKNEELRNVLSENARNEILNNFSLKNSLNLELNIYKSLFS